MLDARIQTMDNQADRFVTKEKKDLIVDSYIKWRISDFSRYYLATGGGDVSQAEVLLKRKFSDRPAFRNWSPGREGYRHRFPRSSDAGSA
ncbi:Modulator of FtsH protease HflC [Raoultella planticola]|uniref:Modulator of FtsH protease HflC n=1 Tax=Raoultella planticola TaxID=575 RepID=A0A485AMA9_RAOPL|nr:Modulator of FtsH protease HflC [Raoultella planticola]